MEPLLEEIARCRVCDLPHEPRPVVAGSPHSKLVIIGQAPGAKVQASGIPWDDQSGRTLRDWLNMSAEVFYDPKSVAILPMGFCFPGSGKSGDLPPRKECAPLWHEAFLNHLVSPTLTLLVGSYAQSYYLKERVKKTLTLTVEVFEEYLEQGFFPLPHPSPRNRPWLKRNPWFEEKVLPALRNRILEIGLAQNV